MNIDLKRFIMLESSELQKITMNIDHEIIKSCLHFAGSLFHNRM